MNQVLRRLVAPGSPGSAYLNAVPDAAPETTTSGAAIPNGTVTYNHGYTGDLKIVPANNSAVPDPSHGTPNLQTLWLERTLAQARRDRGVDMIVVFMHQCAMSTSVPGNGSDLGIRRAWLPLFDRYQVDLVLSGHEHEHERTYPVRGYDRGAHGAVVSPNPDQTAGETIDTRRPSVAATKPSSYNGTPAWDTSQGTVFLVLGGGGTNGPSNFYGTDAADGLPQAKVITERNAITGSQAAGSKRNAADSIEDAPWSAAINASDPYGYAIFDVDPGVRPGDTTITMKYFAIPAVSNEAGTAHRRDHDAADDAVRDVRVRPQDSARAPFRSPRRPDPRGERGRLTGRTRLIDRSRAPGPDSLVTRG